MFTKHQGMAFLNTKTRENDDMRWISVIGYLWLQPRIRMDKEGREFLSFMLTSDPTDTETENVKFHIRVDDPKLISFATHLKSRMKVMVYGEYEDKVSFILGTLLYTQKIKAHVIRLVQFKKPVIK